MVIVVKAGGRVIARNLDNIVKDLIEVSKREKTVFVHGGGDEVTEMCRRLGIEPKFVMSPGGIRSRYTDDNELEVYVMVMAGKINKAIVSKIIGLGGRAVGISGADGPTLVAERKRRIIVVDERGRKRVVSGGYTGKIVSVNVELINTLLNLNYIVVVAPIAVDREGTLLNVDGDQAAYAIASALSASKVVYLSDVDGVIIDGAPIKEIKVSQSREILEKVGVGMNRKVMLAAKAVKEGVGEAIIASGLREKPITEALNGLGTRIRR